MTGPNERVRRRRLTAPNPPLRDAQHRTRRWSGKNKHASSAREKRDRPHGDIEVAEHARTSGTNRQGKQAMQGRPQCRTGGRGRRQLSRSRFARRCNMTTAERSDQLHEKATVQCAGSSTRSSRTQDDRRHKQAAEEERTSRRLARNEPGGRFAENLVPQDVVDPPQREQEEHHEHCGDKRQ